MMKETGSNLDKHRAQFGVRELPFLHRALEQATISSSLITPV
jgi:hypothetical protein